jgi:hypothetical protein
MCVKVDVQQKNQILAEVSVLFHKLTGKNPCVYADYLRSNRDSISIFVIYDEYVKGFAEAYLPSQIDQKTGYVSHCYIEPGTSKKAAEGLHKAIVEWYRAIGVEKIEMATERKPEVFLRAYGYKPSKKILMEYTIE